MHDSISRNIKRTAAVFLALFVMLFVYISYLHIVEADVLASHALNRRTAEIEKRIPRGRIVDKQGKELSFSEKDNEEYYRNYPFGAAFAHIVGYDSPKYGRAGVESSFNSFLTGLGGPEFRLGPLSQLWRPKSGNTVVMTVDAAIQRQAYRAMGEQKGAIVVLDPKTGEVLAIVSKPSFDPNSLDEDWQVLSGRTDSPLLNRAVQGLYPPGSIIKTMIAEAALTEKTATLKTIFQCEGSYKIGSDYTLPEVNQKAHGKINLEQALAVSCNVTFGKLALQLGRSGMEKSFERYGFTKAIGSEFQESASRLPDFSKLTDGELAQVGIGQGPLLTTPLRMAMLAGAYANKGIMMKPYMVSKIVSPDGATLKQYTPEAWLSPVKAATNDAVSQMMRTVVSDGTGTGAYIKGVPVAGKTGTAENAQGQPHAWFIGYAPANNPQIAIAVVVENAGSGGSVAAPIARQVILEALR